MFVMQNKVKFKNKIFILGFCRGGGGGHIKIEWDHKSKVFA